MREKYERLNFQRVTSYSLVPRIAELASTVFHIKAEISNDRFRLSSFRLQPIFVYTLS